MAKKLESKTSKLVEALVHRGDKRKNIPTAELQSVVQEETKKPVELRYPRNPDLDPQLVWRGKDQQNAGDLVVHAPPLYIQEKIHPKVLIDDLLEETKRHGKGEEEAAPELFADFNGAPKNAEKTEFYKHDQNWTNRMILGDGLQVMASLAEKEGLRGQVQCIYIDPPYGIKFNSNFQWSTTSRDVKDGKADHITREPEQVKAFRDTWRDGIHSYLTYLRDRLTVARDLLTDSGSIFVQIGDENVHRVRAVMDEVFGEDNFCSVILFAKTGGQAGFPLTSHHDSIVWFAKNKSVAKYRQPYAPKGREDLGDSGYDWLDESRGLRRRANREERENVASIPDEYRVFALGPLYSEGETKKGSFEIKLHGRSFKVPTGRHWKSSEDGIRRLNLADRLFAPGSDPRYVRYVDDFAGKPLTTVWDDTSTGGYSERRIYVVQTTDKVVQRCIQMTSDPGDLVLDPTCGSGTTATVAEQWGRRWITIDTSRVALALARARIMGARYPFYLLADSREGQLKEAEVTRTSPSSQPVQGNIRHGFVYERVPHITLKSIANNAEIDVIWERWQEKLEPLRKELNSAAKKRWHDWEVPREPDAEWSKDTKKLHQEWWEARIARQKEIDASISAKAEFEYLYDKPYEDKKRVRVAGPFTVESVSPHRTLASDENDNPVDPAKKHESEDPEAKDFVEHILENLKTAGVQQSDKKDKIDFTSITAWAGELVCADGRYMEGSKERRAAIFIGPEFGTVQRADLVAAAREAAEAGFDMLVACGFNFEAHATEFDKLGKIPVLKARMNADLHMSDELKNTGKGNLFVVFGEPDIEIKELKDDMIRVKIKGVDVFHPSTGEVRSDDTEGIACWFIDTDYNEESFFVRHAYFLGANDPYGALKTTLKAEVDPEAWESLHSDTSRPLEKPKSRRIAVKVINHLGDEVMKVFKV